MFEVLAILTLPGCGVLALTGLYCLFFCKGETNYRHLTWTAAVFLGAAGLLIGGDALLGCFDLAWRSAPSAVLFGVMLVSGWIGVVFILGCFLPLEIPQFHRYLRRGLKAAVLFFGVLVLLVSLWVGPIMFMFVYGDTERVLEYQGQTLLEVDDGFMDPHWSYYVHHGPLVRGKETVWNGQVPIDKNSN